MMIQYSKGLHIIADIQTETSQKLQHYAALKTLLDGLIRHHGLSIVGQVFHDFDGGGYTGVYCLTESHISIHTWPEFGRVTYDVFLSNFRKNNEDKVRDIHQKLVQYFEPIDKTINELYR